MKNLATTLSAFSLGLIDKPSFIEEMYVQHHAHLFDFSTHLAKTNIKKIEIEDGQVVMTTRDRGVRIVCGPGDQRIAPIETLNFNDYEKDDALIMESLVKDGDSFFDVGANIGWYSINIALARRYAKVHSFEPLPRTYAQLQTNISVNALQNVQTHNFGLSNKAGTFPFYYYAQGSGNASSANLTGRQDVEVVTCAVQTLDQFTSTSATNVDFLKCDVEGAELLVFQGGSTTIARDKPIVFSEILRKWSAKFNYDPNEIFAFFKQMGYQAFTSDRGSLVEFGMMDLNTVQTNFFFLHSEKHAREILRFQNTTRTEAR